MKQKMKQILIFALLAALALSGCGAQPAAPAATTAAITAATTAAAATTTAATTTAATAATTAAVTAAATTTAAATAAATTAATAAATTAAAPQALPRDAFLAMPTTQAAAERAAELEGTQLNLYTWEGMFPQDILDKFESDYGVRINYVNFDFGETMLSKLQASQGADYDVVIVDDYILETVIAEGLAQKLDKAAMPNFKNIDPAYQGQFYDPSDEYTVPYGAGVQTIVYDPARVGIEITGYADLWDSSLADSVGVIANFRVINGMALKVLGKSYNTDDLGEIRAAGDKLLGLAPNIRLIKDDQLQDDLLSGEIDAAVMYTSQVYESVMENPDLRVVFPKEGIGFGVMAGFIPAKAPNPGAAHLFLNYIMNEQIAACCFIELGYYSTNKEANKYFTQDVRDLLILPDGFDKNMEMIENISGEAAAEHDIVWTKFKAAAGQ